LVIKKLAANQADRASMDINFLQALAADHFFLRFKKELATKLAKGRENGQLNRLGKPVNQF
jgi:hypothetical protein